MDQLLKTYLWNAQKRGHPFNLSREAFEKLIFDVCHYCGTDPQPRQVNSNKLVCNGVDRIDSQRGYEMGNVCTACKICNAMKSSHTASDFIQHCGAIARVAEETCHER